MQRPAAAAEFRIELEGAVDDHERKRRPERQGQDPDPDDGACFGQTVTNVKKADGLLFKAVEP